MGDRAFQIAGSPTWNGLPATIWETKTLPAFRKQLKLYLIGNPEHKILRWQWTFLRSILEVACQQWCYTNYITLHII